jgi:hypothetical protein
MKSHRKLELSKETLRCLTSDLPSEKLVDVRGGVNQSLNTCLECVTTIIDPPPTLDCTTIIDPPHTWECPTR